MPFDALRVLSFESRRAQDMEALIRRFGGEPFVAPSVREKPLDDNTQALAFLEQLEAGQFDMVICMTGVGLSYLRDALVPAVPAERLAEALKRVTIVARGPKPVRVLRSLAVPIQVTIPEPNTWREIVDAIAPRPERRIAVQEYGRPNPELTAALESLGATATTVAVYQWELPENLAPLQEAVRRIAQGEVDVAMFTSSIQLDHLLTVARDSGAESAVRQNLATSIVIASIGPVMTAALASQGLPPDIIPDHPNMGALVRAAADLSQQALERKRRSKATEG